MFFDLTIKLVDTNKLRGVKEVVVRGFIRSPSSCWTKLQAVGQLSVNIQIKQRKSKCRKFPEQRVALRFDPMQIKAFFTLKTDVFHFFLAAVMIQSFSFAMSKRK